MLVDKIREGINRRLKKGRYNLKNVMLNGLASSIFTPPQLRRIIYKWYGFIIPSTSTVYAQCFCGAGNGDKGKLRIGEHSYINYRCFLDLGNDIIIGNNVAVAFECTFINSTHETGDSYQRAGKGYALPIKIEDGCWIGANTTIMPGVTIAKGCIIAANSLVTKNTEPNGLYIGKPAKRIKELFV